MASAVLACVLVLTAMTVSLPGAIRPGTLEGQLEVAACAFALLVAVLCHLRWRLVGDAAAAWLMPAMTLWAITAVADALLLSTDLLAGDAIRWLRWGALLTALSLAYRGVAAPVVDARIRPQQLVVAAAMSVLATAGLGMTVMAFLERPVPMEGGFVDGVLACAWTAVGVAYVRRGRREGRAFLGWIGLLLLLFAYGHLVAVVPASSRFLADVGSRFLEVAGLLAAVTGATAALAQAYFDQSGRLLEAETKKRTAEARFEADLAKEVERAHEARNALAAIEGATRALQAYSDQLQPDDRDALSTAVSAEIARLQELVGRPVRTNTTGRFRVAEAIAAVVTCQRSLGAWISVDVPDDLVAVGNPTDTAEVVQNLLRNAHRYGDGKVTVAATLDDDRVVIRVSDQGPGIDTEDRERIFERGVRGRAGAAHEGSGLGLYVSAQLMSEQGGELRLEDDQPATGACFAVVLPGFVERTASSARPVDGVGGQVDDELEQVAEVAAAAHLFLVSATQDADRAAVLTEHHDTARDQLAR
ncbi:sensor histidine kinase [Egicoccus sp. AB-alg2]|uniref:sensor histidine kinase n=1 Tax=Egicoccus sp. AB-alg2 TaxID=3242693 RepID=UPI00359EA012